MPADIFGVDLFEFTLASVEVHLGFTLDEKLVVLVGHPLSLPVAHGYPNWQVNFVFTPISGEKTEYCERGMDELVALDEGLKLFLELG